MLARNLDTAANAGDVPRALADYEAMRRERASKIQVGSRGKAWLKDGGNADWVYGYNAWSEALPSQG